MRFSVALFSIYLVTWKTFVAVERTDVAFTDKENQGFHCELKEETHQREYYDWFKATLKSTELKAEVGNFDVKIWELEEPPQPKERK